jgi:hypothetical protein
MWIHVDPDPLVRLFFPMISKKQSVPYFQTVLEIRIRIRIHMFLGLQDLDPLVRGTDSDPL